MTTIQDYLARREERRQKLLQDGATEGHLLEQLRQTIRGIRESLPTYRRVQEARRYQMTIEDVEDLEQRYAQLKNDSAGIHETEDYVDALLDAQDTSEVIAHVLTNHGRGGQRTPVMQRRISPGWLIVGAIVIILLARSCGAF